MHKSTQKSHKEVGIQNNLQILLLGKIKSKKSSKKYGNDTFHHNKCSQLYIIDGQKLKYALFSKKSH